MMADISVAMRMGTSHLFHLFCLQYFFEYSQIISNDSQVVLYRNNNFLLKSHSTSLCIELRDLSYCRAVSANDSTC